MSVAAVRDLVAGLIPGDELEKRHRLETLDWLRSTNDVFRRVKPATPARHLVSGEAGNAGPPSRLVRRTRGSGRQRLPGRPRRRRTLATTGRHVEPDEHPARTAVREAREELGIDPDANVCTEKPIFLTVTTTVGIDAGHTDVSLWFVVACRPGQSFRLDPDEFRSGRWWTPAQLRDADPARFDPHLTRFVAKLAR